MNDGRNFAHLNPEASEAMRLSLEKRKAYIRAARWIGYPRAKDILLKLEDLLVYPKKHRMPNLLLVGDSNSGKTMLIERFVATHLPYEREDKQGIVIPALFVQAPPVPNESRFYTNILEKLFAPYRVSDPVEKKQYQVIKLMEACNVKMLIIDEIHSVLAGNTEKQRVFLSVLRNLGNELRIPIVAVGTKDALRAIKTDPQLDNRFKTAYLPRWEYGNDFRRLLASFEMMLPLGKPSNLKSVDIAKKLFVMSEGLLGELAELLSEASVQAINTGEECISFQLLANLDWQAPSKRRVENA